MDRHPSRFDPQQALELRVLEGPQAGARAPLMAGSSCVIAAAAAAAADMPGADIVLRDSDTPARVRVVAQPTAALIEVLDGEVHIGDQVLAAGAQCGWPRHVPLRLGNAVVAFGLAHEEDWPAATAQAALPGPSSSTSSGALAEPTAQRVPLRRRTEAWLAATGAGVVIACAGSLWMAHVSAAPQPRPALTAPALAMALQGGEFAALQPGREADGRIVLRGRLGTAAQRGRLEAWLAARDWSPALDLWIDESIARELTEVLRVNGIAGQSRIVGAGRFQVEVAERDAQRLARAEDILRRDVRGVAELVLRNTAAPLPPAVAPLPEDPNKRIASLVPGDPAYVVTVDGARYFVGAMLPSGHRITQIAAQRVVLERDGQSTNLNF